MKKILLAFVLFLFAQSSFAQSISIDSSFSGDGRVETGITPTESLSKFTTIQPNGKYILTGKIEPNASHCSMKRYYPDGTLDSTFQFNNTDLYIYAICLQDDGKIICATYNGLVRLHSNGQLDTSFVTSQVTQLANYYHLETRILSNGKIVSCGFKINPTNDGIYVAVFNPDGTPDTNFAQSGIFKYHPTFIDLVFSLKTQQDGKIVFSGCSMVDDEAFITLYRLTDKGILDADFGVNGVILESLLGAGEGFEMDIQADGKIVVAGYLFTQNSSKACVLRYLPNGTRDPDFGVNGVCIIPGATTT
ncbi:MAG: hypothetical protein H7246_00080, partial [Phycisphaerae bacterium]|nr:hypothetical protein [Saprospiraceae bacterium]